MIDESKKNFYVILITIFIAIVSRFLSVYYYGETSLTNEWNILFHNFKNFGVLGINIFDGKQVVMGIASTEDKILPSVYMPPLYLFYIILLNYFVSIEYLVNTILISQIFISIIASIIFFKLLKKFFNFKISYIGLCLFLFFPINIYATSQISSITMQVFLIIIFFYYIFEVIQKRNFKSIFYLCISSSALLLLRGEFIVILLFTYIFIFYSNINFKIILSILFVTLIIISPYIHRNFKLFNQFTITKSFGFNLWKGNNLYSNSEGSEKIYDLAMQEKIEDIKPTNMYEIKKDAIYKNQALNNILSDPKIYFYSYLNKIFALLFFDKNSSYKYYYNFLHIIPKILIGITTILGILVLGLKKNNLHYFSFIFVLYILLFSLFFVLPRYGLSLLPTQIILCCSFFSFIETRFKKN